MTTSSRHRHEAAARAVPLTTLDQPDGRPPRYADVASAAQDVVTLPDVRRRD